MEALIFILVVLVLIFVFRYEKEEIRLLKKYEKFMPIVSKNDLKNYKVLKELEASSLDENGAKIELYEEALKLGATNLIDFQLITDTKIPPGQKLREPKGSFISKQDNSVFYVTHYIVKAVAVKRVE